MPRLQREYTHAFWCHCQRLCVPSHPALRGNLNWTPLCVYTNAKIRWMLCYFKVSTDILFPSLLYLVKYLEAGEFTLSSTYTSGCQQINPNTIPLNTPELFWFVPAEDPAWGWCEIPLDVPHTSGKCPSQISFSYTVRATFPLTATGMELCPGTPTGSAAAEENWARSEKANGTGSTGLSHTGCPAGVQEAGQLH